ncbi:MAG TPA: response regulator [Alphaproteobacteria bacterium]|jgi:two-component system phosphate regulon response regulator OmpR|nr:response regulator [Alphaproteobacteria bacterium]
MDTERPHILVVDDDGRIRDLLTQYLRDHQYNVTAAADAAEARRKMAGLEFDLIVLDVMMPGEDGFELTRALRRRGNVPILLLTARGEPEDRITGLETGADDYLAKPFEPRELLLRVGSILRRSHKDEVPAGVFLGNCYFDIARMELRRDERPVRLTSAEASLLTIFARKPGATISRLELCERSGGVNERSIDVQVTRLRRKIEPDPKAPRYLQTVWGEGYILNPD